MHGSINFNHIHAECRLLFHKRIGGDHGHFVSLGEARGSCRSVEVERTYQSHSLRASWTVQLESFP
jgi:hypothetical protein